MFHLASNLNSIFKNIFNFEVKNTMQELEVDDTIKRIIKILVIRKVKY